MAHSIPQYRLPRELLDVETGKPILPAFGRYTGPAVCSIILRCVAQIARAVKIPVSGIGGVSTWKHAVEMMMVGATTVQVGTVCSDLSRP